MEAAESIARVGTSKALDYLRMASAEDVVDRPHYLANAIAQFGRPGFDVLLRYTSSLQRESPRLCRGGSKSLTDTGVHQGNS